MSLELPEWPRPAPCRNGFAELGRMDQADWQWKVMLPLAPLVERLPAWRRDDGE